MVPVKPIPRMDGGTDGSGVPVVKKESEGRQGKGEDGQAKTREIKLGCVFTPTGVDEENRLICDEESPHYTGGLNLPKPWGRGFIKRPSVGVWTGRPRFVGSATAPSGFGISRMSSFREPPIVDL